MFGDPRFDAFKTDIGIVGTRWEDARPIIFKTNPGQAFTGAGAFEPGFGCTIADAVIGSCSAYPFFLKKMVTTGRGDKIEVRDGGFVANNPTLYAIADATGSLAHPAENVRVVSVGVGEYPAPKLAATSVRKWFSKWPTVKFAQVLEINTQSMDELRRVNGHRPVDLTPGCSNIVIMAQAQVCVPVHTLWLFGKPLQYVRAATQSHTYLPGLPKSPQSNGFTLTRIVQSVAMPTREDASCCPIKLCNSSHAVLPVGPRIAAEPRSPTT